METVWVKVEPQWDDTPEPDGAPESVEPPTRIDHVAETESLDPNLVQVKIEPCEDSSPGNEAYKSTIGVQPQALAVTEHVRVKVEAEFVKQEPGEGGSGTAERETETAHVKLEPHGRDDEATTTSIGSRGPRGKDAQYYRDYRTWKRTEQEKDSLNTTSDMTSIYIYRTSDPSTIADLSPINVQGSVTPKKKRKTRAEYQKEYRARKKAKRNNILTDSPIVIPSTSTGGFTTQSTIVEQLTAGPSIDLPTTAEPFSSYPGYSKPRGKRKTPAEYQRAYRARKKAQREARRAAKTNHGSMEIADENTSNNGSEKPQRDANEQPSNQAPVDLGPNSCKICGKEFKQSYNIKAHMRIHNGDRAFPCTMCEKRFITPRDLKTHERTHTGEKPYKCPHCTKVFSQLGNLKTHERTHTGDKPHSCKICHKLFAETSSLKKHEMIHTGEKPYSCAICSRKFRLSSILNKHQRVHMERRPYACEICKREFALQSELQIHERIHTGEKPFACSICDKEFTRHNTLKRHERIHSGEKLYSCETCYKDFTNSSDLKKHIRIHTGERPYSCEICYKNFKGSSAYNRHKLIHTDTKPFACDICHKEFRQSSSLKDHLRIHTGEKPYACTMCDKEFRESCGLRRHERVHMKQQLCADTVMTSQTYPTDGQMDGNDAVNNVNQF